MAPTPDIYLYLDYRKFLADFYKYSKLNSPHFSYRSFSQKVGVQTSNFLLLLIQGKRNLKDQTIPLVAKALKLDQKQSQYFQLLVLYGQEKNTEQKSSLFRELQNLRSPYEISKMSELQFEQYNHWYYKAIRELLSFYPFNPSEKYAFRHLAAQLYPNITESDARKAIKVLEKLNLIYRHESGVYKLTDQFISTGDEVQNFFLRRFHQCMIEISKSALDEFPLEVRDISSLTLSISNETFVEIKTEIQLFRKRLLEIARKSDRAENVYQINFQAFPLTRKAKKPDSVDKSLMVGGTDEI